MNLVADYKDHFSKLKELAKKEIQDGIESGLSLIILEYDKMEKLNDQYKSKMERYIQEIYSPMIETLKKFYDSQIKLIEQAAFLRPQ